jgi:hypothetical protein
MGEERKVYRDLVGRQKERDHLEAQGVDGMMGSDWILGRFARGCRVDPVGSGQVPLAGFCEGGDEPAGSGATELVIAIVI